MSNATEIGAGCGEYPAVLIFSSLALSPKDIRKFRSDRLLAHTGFGLRDKEAQTIEIEVIEARPQDFAAPHAGVEPDGDEQPAVGVIVLECRLHKRVGLGVGQYGNSAGALGQKLHLAWSGLDPAPLDGLVKKVTECGEFSIDGAIRCSLIFAAFLIAIDRKDGDGVESLRAKKRNQSPVDVLALLSDVAPVAVLKPLKIGARGLREGEGLALVRAGITSVTDAAEELELSKGAVSKLKKKLQAEGKLEPGRKLALAV